MSLPFHPRWNVTNINGCRFAARFLISLISLVLSRILTLRAERVDAEESLPLFLKSMQGVSNMARFSRICLRFRNISFKLWKDRLSRCQRALGMKMVRRIYCDKCGRELAASELIQLLDYEPCSDCCRQIVRSK